MTAADGTDSVATVNGDVPVNGDGADPAAPVDATAEVEVVVLSSSDESGGDTGDGAGGIAVNGIEDGIDDGFEGDVEDDHTDGVSLPLAPPDPLPELSGPPSARLAQLGIELPAVPAPLAAYVPATRTGNLVFTSGQLPLVDGTLPMSGVVGDQPVDVTPDEGAALARICAVNAIAAATTQVPLDSLRRVVKVVAFVASAPGFGGQPEVANGASMLLQQVFGDAGVHARSAVGVTALPRKSPVEVEVVFEVVSEVDGATGGPATE
jgi:enamine deaminase RidA (YjgF/YER057c/UK114 family)